MYPISNTVKALFEAEMTQVLRITGTDKNGETISITGADVVMNSFNIDRYSCNGEKLEVGTAIAAGLEFKLYNGDGRFDDIIFEGAELFVEIGIADWTQETPVISYIPCGYFTPDEQPRKRDTISIQAMDRMARFDRIATSRLGIPWTNEDNIVITDENGNKIYFAIDIEFPIAISELISRIAMFLDVPFLQDISGLPNSSAVITAFPSLDYDVTFRNIIQWCAGIMGTNAWIDWDGNLRFSWYNNSTNYVMTTANRFDSDLQENAIVISGVEFTDSDNEKTVYLAGSRNYTLSLTGNAFLNGDNVAPILTNIYNVVHDYAYTPFEASVINVPYLWPMDRVVFTDKDGNGHVSLLTNVNFGVNGNANIAGRGLTAQLNNGVSSGAFTKEQRQLLQTIQSVNDNALSEAVDSATAQITGADGGYVRFMYDANDKLIEILIMDNEDVATATKVWRWNSGGLGYSANGYAGPYTTAITQDGSIVANFITSGEMSANRISGGTIDGTTVNAKLLQIVNADGDVLATFNNVITLGQDTDVHVAIDFNSLEMYDKNNNLFLSLGDMRDSEGTAEFKETFVGNGTRTSFGCTYSIASVVSVTVNGSVVSNYTVNYSYIIFSSAPSDGSSIVVLYRTTAVCYHYDLGTRNPNESIFGPYSSVNGYFLIASGAYSHAEGGGCVASGYMSHAEGFSTVASGVGAHAEGNGDGAYISGLTNPTCVASGNGSHAEGYSTTASGPASHSEGRKTTASGNQSHAEGIQTTASSYQSHAEGTETVASGHSSHAEGQETTASAQCSHAEGANSVSSGYCSHAEGHGTIANKEGQHVVGRWNIADPAGSGSLTYFEIVGNGTSDSNRVNIRTLDYNGNERISGSYLQISDRRYKDECGTIPDMSMIQARRYKWNDKKPVHDDKEHLGYFAQDVEAIAPYLISEDETGYKSLDYNGVFVAKIAALERRIAELEKKLSEKEV